ncbi:MAG: ABC transporter ATP-binding protein/permease [Candidatus Nomurabacteria bacterium]|jgi:ATP-binding cassette subfamily B protein|nr:ABC transporter ATP-binding protein/permease [Candidatus Nomurabacteria bacterium]
MVKKSDRLKKAEFSASYPKKVGRFLLSYWWMILILLCSVSVQVWASLQLPNMMANIVNKGIVGEDQNIIIQTGLQMLGITAIGGVAMVLTGFLSAKIGTGFSQKIRDAVFEKVESFSMNEINKFSTASLITRSTNDVQQLQQVSVLIMRMVLQAPIMAVGAIINAWNTAPNMTWAIGAGVVALFVLVGTLFMIVMPKFKVIQKLTDKLNLVARENLTGLRIIRAFRNEKYQEKKFDRVNKDIMKLNIWINRAFSFMQPIMMLIFNGTILAIIWVGAHFVATNDLEIGNMMAFMQYTMQVIMSFLFLAVLIIFLPRAQVSASRINEILQTKLSIKDPKNPEKLDPKKRGLVEFREVTFTYPDAEVPILNDINFVANPGQTTAFIGSTGAGKSTVVNLIPRFYDVSAGQILVDGVDVRKIAHHDLISRIGFVPQKGVLFSGTIESNIKYGAPKIFQDEVENAAKIAQADFIKTLDDAFQYHVAQGGSNLSGGQKQRLAIARAVAKNPEIYVFDDSFSALDYKTDAKLREALKPITKNATVLIVAQRISTIKHAEKIIVLDGGNMVGSGTHAELLKNCEVYREIARSQFSDEEMARELATIADEEAKK